MSLPFPVLPLRSLSTCAALVALLCSNPCSAQDRPPAPAQSATVPTFEALPNTPLPPGTFAGWCGREDRYLLVVQGWIDVYEKKTKVSAPSSFSTRHSPQCRQGGRELVYYDEDAGLVQKVEIETGKKVVLATFKVETRPPTISFSPDLQSIATDRSLKLTAEARNLKIIQVKETPEERVSRIIWSQDSARMMVVYSGSIDVLDANGGRAGGGRLPKGKYAREGWFDADHQAVVLFLIKEDDESGPGGVVKCSITNWKCSNVKLRVDSVAVGGRGLIGTVGPLDKPRVGYDDAIPLYSRYAAELRDPSKLLARQVFSASLKGRSNYEIQIAPSGRLAVVTWRVDASPACPKQERGESCQQGIMMRVIYDP